ncbi:MAG: gliding motility-associated C-terminal domain-containing protein [Cyclobacteriaceae bacterium]
MDCINGGSILATIDSSGIILATDPEYVNFEFYWYRGDVVNPPNELPTITRNLTEISPGVNLYADDYTVYAVNTYTHCISNTVTGTLVAPAPLFEILSEVNFYPSDCQADSGALTSWVNNAGVRDYNFNFYWYEGRNINPGSNFYTDPQVAFEGPVLNNDFPSAIPYLGSPQPNRNTQEGPTIYNIGDGIYSVVVEDRNTGCMEYLEVPLPSIITPPTLLGTVQGSSLCPYTIGDGIVEAAIDPDSLGAQGLLNSDYEFFLFEGISTDINDTIGAPVLGFPDTITFTRLSDSLAPGFYTIVAEEQVSGSFCPSVPLTVEILPLALPPVVDLATDILHNTSCDSAFVNGAIELDVGPDPNDLTPPGSTYKLLWSSTASTVPADDSLLVAGTMGPFGGLNFGTYDVTVIDQDSRCETSRSYEIFNTPPPIAIQASDIVVTDKFACVPSGSIEITQLTINGSTDPVGNYEFLWYDGAGNLAANDSITGVTTEYLDSMNFTTIHAGDYYVVATKTDVVGGITDGLGCETPPIRSDITDRTVDPVLAYVTTANNSCLPGVIANGEIQLTITPGTLSNNLFNYTWNTFPLTSPGDLSAGSINESFFDLPPGTYEVEIIDSVSRCLTVNQITINDDPIIPVVQDPDIQTVDQEICGPDGSITVVKVILNGVEDGTADYTFAWYNTSDSLNAGQELNVIPAISGPVVNITNYPNIGAGIYYFTATKNNPADPVGYGCQSAPYQAVIDDLSIDPVLALSMTPNQSCDTAVAATGTITALITESPNSLGNFNYTWLSYPTDNPGDFAGSTNELFTDRSYGQYSLLIEDADTRCIANASITVTDNPYIPVALTVDVTDQDICDYSGSVTVSSIDPGTTGEYTFTWYDGNTDLNNGTSIAGVTGSILDVTTYPTVQAGDYYFTAQKTDPTDPVGYMCESSPYQATINDISEDPVLALNMTANQSCDTSVVATGEIRAVVTPALNSTDRFNYTWTAFPTDRPDQYVDTDSLDVTFANRSFGQYTLQIEDVFTRCVATSSITVINNPFTPIIDNTDYLVNDQSVCFNDGGVIVFGIFPGDTSQYDFAWYEGVTNLNNDVSIAGVTDGILDTTTYASVQAGNYYFTATNVDTTLAIGYGCETAPILATINDVSVDPLITLVSTANQNCDLSFANGTILADVTTDGVPGPSYSYTLSSSVLGSPIDSLLNDAQVLYDSLRPGNYNVYVIDDITQCVANRSMTVDDSPVFIEVTDINFTVTDQIYCAPDGSIVINDITENGIIQNLADYSYVWYQGEDDLNNDNPIAGVPDSYLDTTNFATIGAGNYYFTVTKLASAARPGVGCESAPLRADIFDLHTDPNVIFDLITNTSCDPTNPNGILTATSFENDGTDTDTYSFVWSYNGGALPAGVVQDDSVNISQLSMAPEGQYELIVTNTSRTQCFLNGGTTLDIDPYAEVPNIIVVDVTDPLFCYPTGALEVTQITVNGQPANVNDFEYDWYQSNFTPGDLILDSLGNPVTNSLLSDIYPNTYYVIARDTITLCESPPKEAVVSDANIVYPVIHITQSAPQTSCDPMQPNASLMATADGGNDDTNPNYQFTWFNSLDGSGSPIGTTSTIYGLGADDFSVSVFNAITGCSALDYYITEDDILNSLPVVSVAAAPQTNCIVDNGSVSAQVINYTGSFRFDWYIGDAVGTAADFTGQSVSPLPPGYYTVTATELDTTYCSSEPVVVEIKDERMAPNVLIEEDNPLTNCWITDPNGQFSATVNGMVGGYTFEWYIGTDTTGTPDHVEATYSGLSPQSYTLVVTDNLTRCAAVRSVDLTDSTIAPPVADPEVVQHLLSCIELDGWVRASVGGNTIDYIFNWSNGSSVNDPADWTGINYRDLDAGVYTVTAQDMITGCISDGRQVEVLDQREMPMFSFDVVPARCENSDGSIEIVWENEVPIGNTTWYDSETGQHIETGSAIYEYPPGWYEVVVISAYGCEEVQEVEIPTEIFEFNGVSANGDGRNDYFDIACISMFPDNHVRIYNRAGQLVYEEFGYNNMDKAFTGIGENGMYLAGRELPDGTYFYIIDKRDGSEPVAGYLELIR